MDGYRSLVCWILFGLIMPAAADEIPDYDREQRIVEQIEPQIFDGEAVWLPAGEREFLGIYMEADESKGSVIILHGRDVSPEDQNVAGPLLVGPAESGWSTLALQMPVLAKGKKYYDYLPFSNMDTNASKRPSIFCAPTVKRPLFSPGIAVARTWQIIG